MSNYTKTTDFEAKDSLPSGDSGKIIRGSEFETEFDNIATAIASKSDANNPTFTGTVTIDGLTVNGNTVLGNAATDTVTVTADIASNLLPSADDTYNLGAVGAEWNDLYVDGVAYIDTIDGFATTGNVTFGDNDKAVFGAGSDLQIYHDGDNSYIRDSGSGNLRITSDSQVFIAKHNSENMLRATADGSVDLYYDNATKLATTSTGIDVTGTVTADGLDVSTATGSASPTPSKITIATTSTGSDWSTTNPWGSLAFYSADTSSGGAKEQVTLDAVASNSSGGISEFRINTYNSGLKERLRVSYNGDISFLEDSGTTAKFFWDSSAEALGIGTSSPSRDLSLNSSGTTTLQVTNDTVGTSTTDGFQIKHYTSGATQLWGYENSYMAFATNNAERLRIDSSGNVGIGTTSPGRKFTVQGGSGDTLPVRIIGGSGTTTSGLEFQDPSTTADYKVQIGSAGDNLYLRAGGAEAMRIDSSGNLLVGTTSASTWTNTAGFAYRPSSSLSVTRSAGEVVHFNRLTSDGTIVDLRKDGAAVGSIGTHNIASSSRLYVGSGDVNLMFRPDIEVIQPASNTGLRDAAISLGNASGRFKDLYLSGGLHGDTTFKNNAGTTEYARFNSSGNLLVGKISTGTTNVGTQITGDGFTSIVGTNNNIPLYLENKGTNGNCRISFANNSHGGASLGLNNGGDFTIFDSTASTTRFNVTSSRVITASGGIAGIELGGVGVNNRLDDYEEGTFTPVVTGSTTAGTGTYSSQSGTYTKVGQVVTCSFAVNMTAHDGAGNIRISLPFSSNTNAVGVVMDQNLNYGSGASLVAFTQNQEFVQLYAVGDNLAWDVQTLADDTAFTLFVTITYRT